MRRVLDRLVFVGDASRRDRLLVKLVNHTVRVRVVRELLLIEQVISLIFVDGPRLSADFPHFVGHLCVECIYDNFLDHDGSVLLSGAERALELAG